MRWYLLDRVRKLPVFLVLTRHSLVHTRVSPAAHSRRFPNHVPQPAANVRGISHHLGQNQLQPVTNFVGCAYPSFRISQILHQRFKRCSIRQHRVCKPNRLSQVAQALIAKRRGNTTTPRAQRSLNILQPPRMLRFVDGLFQQPVQPTLSRQRRNDLPPAPGLRFLLRNQVVNPPHRLFRQTKGQVATMPGDKRRLVPVR